MKKQLLLLSLCMFTIKAASNGVHYIPSQSAGVHQRSINFTSKMSHPLLCEDVALQMERYKEYIHTMQGFNPEAEEEMKAKYHTIFFWFEANCVRQANISDLQ